VDNLRIKLLGEEKAELVTRYTQNPEAYNLFLKGLYFWHKRTADDLGKAIDHFVQAIKLDSNYALAYARLAESYGLLAWYTSILPKEVFTKAKSAVMKALAIDENLAEAHSALGFIKMYYDWDWEASEVEFKRAIQTKPGYVTAHQWYAEYLTLMGRHEEALEEIQIALELDPLSLLINHHVGYHLYFARQYDKAAEQFQKTLELDSNYDVSLNMLGNAYLEMGMYDEAIGVFQKRGHKPALGIAYARAGKRDEALGILQEMMEQWKRGEMHAIKIADIFAALVEEEMTMDWLERSFERREMQLVFLKVSKKFDNFHSSPRFIAILKKMNLE
jgi:tetratricopeptide (TPR) repeat protein